MAYEPAKRLARLNLEVQNGLVGAKLVYGSSTVRRRKSRVPPCRLSKFRAGARFEMSLLLSRA